MTCPKCGIENIDQARYCRSCGTALKPSSKITKAQLEGQLIEKDAELASLREEIVTLEHQRLELNAQQKKSQKKISELRKSVDSLSQQISDRQDTCSPAKSHNAGLSILGIFVLLVLILTCIAQCDGKKTAIRDIDNLSKELSSVKSKNYQLEKLILDVSRKYPILINKIEVRNEGEEYGATIYSKNTTYINLKVSTLSLVNKDVEVFVKMIDPWGTVTRGESSPEGYSYTGTIKAKQGENQTTTFTGWGNKTKGNWPAGKYKLELYIDNKLVGEKNLTIK